MKVTVIQANFQGGKQEIRDVFINEENKSTIELLNEVYKNGQNEFSNQKDSRSLSIGDIIELNKEYYLIDSFGFIKEGENKPLPPEAQLWMKQEGNLFLKEKFGYLLKE